MNELKTLKQILDDKLQTEIPDLVKALVDRREEISELKESIKNDALNAAGYDITCLLGDLPVEFTLDLGSGMSFNLGSVFSMNLYSTYDKDSDTRVYLLHDANIRYANRSYGISSRGDELATWNNAAMLSKSAIQDIKNSYLVAEWLTPDRANAIFDILAKHSINYNSSIIDLELESYELGKKIETRIATYVEYNVNPILTFGMEVNPLVPIKEQLRLRIRWIPKFNKMTKKNVSITYVDERSNQTQSKNIKMSEWTNVLVQYLAEPFKQYR